MEWSQLLIPLICWRTKHLLWCGIFIPFLKRHLEIFSSWSNTPQTELHHLTPSPSLGYIWGRHNERQDILWIPSKALNVCYKAHFLDVIPQGTLKWLLNMGRHMTFQPPKCNSVCWVSIWHPCISMCKLVLCGPGCMTNRQSLHG